LNGVTYLDDDCMENVAMLIRKFPKCGELLLTKESHPEFISRMAFFESIVYQTFPRFMQN